MERRTRPTIEIWRNLGLPISMVPPLHQTNVYIKRVVGMQTIRNHGAPYRTDIGNLGKFGTTYLPGTTFTPKQ